ncbi:MAG TPA: phasin [Xanthobacteraceae bacterium]|nr:phasin [Xanthobacteraceae bacterium]
MAEATAAQSKAKAKPATGNAFEGTAFEFPKFDMPKMEVPPAFREFAEKSASQAKENYEKLKTAAEEATDILEDTYTSATKGASAYGLKMIEVARVNTDAAFDFMSQVFAAKSASELVEITTAHSRKQFETLTAQSKDLTSLAQKVATDASEPLKDSISKVFKKVA